MPRLAYLGGDSGRRPRRGGSAWKAPPGWLLLVQYVYKSTPIMGNMGNMGGGLMEGES